jgi:hypothetical protein
MKPPTLRYSVMAFSGRLQGFPRERHGRLLPFEHSPVRYMPISHTPREMHAYEVHAHETPAHHYFGGPLAQTVLDVEI